MARCIINVSTKKYWKGQERLAQSISQNMLQSTRLFVRHEEEIKSPNHTEKMYAFKPYCFDYAYRMGFRQILWLDSSMYVLKDLTPIFEQIERDGYYWQDSGWMNKRFTPENVKDYFGTSEGKMISSGVVGLNLESEIALEFLEYWKNAADAGMFNGSHENHRHDQTCASLIIQQMGLKITPNETHWIYGEPTENYRDNILLVANGIC